MIYLAGPLFTAAERRWNVEVAEALERMGIEVFLPQRDALPIIDRLLEDNNEMHYEYAVALADKQGIDMSHALVACLDGADADSGTAWEMGYAFTRIPVYWYRTDLRKNADDPEGVNLMLSGAAEQIFIGDKPWDARAQTVAQNIHLAFFKIETKELQDRVKLKEYHGED